MVLPQAMESPGVASLDKLPVGYGFRPTEEELVDHFLKKKLLGDRSVNQRIAEVDVCKVEPWELPAFSKVKSDDPEWFFFSPRNLKYTNSNRSNRATKAGYWKVTGKYRKIKARRTNIVIGTKKTLVFYKGRSPGGAKTNWVIHEYHTVRFDASQRNFVLCRLKEKAEKKAEEGKDALINHVSEPSNHMDFDSEDPEAIVTIHFQYFLPEVNLEAIFQPEEYNFPSIQQEPSFPSYCKVNRNSNMDFPVETAGEEDNIDQDTDIDKFLTSLLTSEDVYASAESSHAFVSDFASSGSLRGTDTELFSSQYGTILDPISSLCKEHGGSREFRVNNINGVAQVGTFVLSSHEVNQVEKACLQGPDTSNDLPADKHLPPIFSMTSIPSPPAPRGCETKYHSRSDNLVSQKSAERSQSYGKLTTSSKEATTSEVKKETETQESKKDPKKAEGSNSRKNTGTTSSGGNKKGIPLLGLSPRPRPICTINEVLDRLAGFSFEDHSNHRRHPRS